MHHLQNRAQGIDLFSEFFFALGFNDSMDSLNNQAGTNVADIIDLQVERQKLTRKRTLDATTGDPVADESDTDSS